MPTQAQPQSIMVEGKMQPSTVTVSSGADTHHQQLTAIFGDPSAGMIPTNGNAQYGIINVSSPFNQTIGLSENHYAGKSQNLGGRITGQFFVYHELIHGQDDFLIVYVENSIISVGGMIADEQLARGMLLHRVDSEVRPLDSRCAWVSSSPATVNQSQTVTSTVNSSYTNSVTVGVNKDGGSGSATSSETYGIGSSTTVTVKDWNVSEMTDGGSGMGKWNWYQNAPWSGDVETNDFSWWQDAYNCGGGWDDTKPLTDISKTSLQYTSCISWRMPGNLVKNGSLPVTFQGSSKYYFAAVFMPQSDNTGNHRIQYNQPVNSWSVTIDLAKAAKLS